MTTQQPASSAESLDSFRYRQAGPVQLYLGDARAVLAAMPDASVDCIVTSPPFWALRDYGTGRWDGGDPDLSGPNTWFGYAACEYSLMRPPRIGRRRTRADVASTTSTGRFGGR